ncbi:MAG TPA: LysR family transcriptional regulator [Candidatus Acidoferrum sp.]|jgi:DNA-binding transcriptional LysR family regulator|nr:LysR family transcriptional regulator [Candidatus Acidoferrum sp.]
MSRFQFTLEQVRTFVAVAETEHISKAATSLFLTQGAVTQQLRHFEDALGLQLMERAGRGVRLTDAGSALATACKAVLRAVETLQDTARSMKALESGSLDLGASPTCASYYLPARLAAFAARYPAVKLTVTVEPSAAICEQVLAGAIDCAVIEVEPPAELMSVVLAQDELVLVAHRDHPLSELTRVTPAQLAKYRYLGRGPAWTAEQTVRTMIGRAYNDSEVLNLGHPEYVRAAAIAGLGYAVLPRLAVEADLAAGILKRLPGPSSMRAISAIRRRSAGGPTLEEFWRHLTAGAPVPA